MAEAPEFSEEKILADFYETQPHFTEPESVQSTSESQSRVIQTRPLISEGDSTESIQSQDEIEETVVEVFEPGSDSSKQSETKEKPPQVSEGSPVIQVFPQSSRKSSYRPTEEQKYDRRPAASAPPIYRKPLQSIQKRPSTTKTFRRKLTSRDFKKNVIQSPSQRSGRRNSAPSTSRSEIENSVDFPQSSRTERASTAGPSLRIPTQERQETVVEIEDSSPPPSRIGSAKLAVRNRLANLLRMEMATRGMQDDVRRNLFSPSLQILEATLFLGSLVFIVPFTIQVRSGEYVLEAGIFRTAITGILLLCSILLHAFSTYASIKNTTVQIVFTVTNGVDEAAMILILLAFGYSLFCRSRFKRLFQSFAAQFYRHSDHLQCQRQKVTLWALLPFLLCISMGNWIAWGETARLSGLGETFGYYRKIGVGRIPFLNGIGPDFQNVLTVIHIFLTTYAHCVVIYTEMLLWAASLSIYWMEKKKRAYCIQDNVEFDLAKGTSVFRDLHEVVNRQLSRPLGPLLAVSCISMVTYNVSGLTTLCFGDWRWHIPIIMIIKAGHVLIAAEATANDENLLHQILTKRLSPISTNDADDVANLPTRFTYETQLREFKDAAREPLALKALDFANMNYALFGWVLVSAIGYFLVVAEWVKAENEESR